MGYEFPFSFDFRPGLHILFPNCGRGEENVLLAVAAMSDMI
jgi:hypothetical protein